MPSHRTIGPIITHLCSGYRTHTRQITTPSLTTVFRYKISFLRRDWSSTYHHTSSTSSNDAYPICYALRSRCLRFKCCICIISGIYYGKDCIGCNCGGPYNCCNQKSSYCCYECYLGSTATKFFLSEPSSVLVYEEYIKSVDKQDHASRKPE